MALDVTLGYLTPYWPATETKGRRQRAIEEGNTELLEKVAAIVKRTGALDTAMRSAQAEVARALDASKHLPAGPYVDCMVQLAQQSLVRSS